MDEQTRAAEIEAIKQVVATLQHATNNELPDEFVGLFRADAIWTTGGGKRLVGRDEISAFTHQVLPGGMQGLSITFEVEHILFIRPDVAAVKSLQQYLTLDGQPVGNQGTPLHVMAKEDGQWRLVAAQNSDVLDS